MKGKTAEEVAEKCVDFCLIFLIPEAVLIDRDTNFIGPGNRKPLEAAIHAHAAQHHLSSSS